MGKSESTGCGEDTSPPHHLRSNGEYRVWSAPAISMQVFYNPSFVTHDAQRLSYRASDEHISCYTVAVKRRLVIVSAHP